MELGLHSVNQAIYITTIIKLANIRLGKFCAVTNNIEDMHAQIPEDKRLSRGVLVCDYFKFSDSFQYMDHLRNKAVYIPSAHFVFGDFRNDSFFASHVKNKVITVEYLDLSKTFIITNGSANQTWFKTKRGALLFNEVLKNTNTQDCSEFVKSTLSLLLNDRLKDDNALAIADFLTDDEARQASSIFIDAFNVRSRPNIRFATLSSTVITVSPPGVVCMTEQTWQTSNHKCMEFIIRNFSASDDHVQSGFHL